MSGAPQRSTAHTRVVDAPAAAVYDLVATVSRWPAVFGPTVHVDLLEHDGTSERFRLWATLNGEVRNWTSRRTLDRDRLRIGFRQEHGRAPVLAMSGHWRFRPLDGGRTEVELGHTFSAEDEERLELVTAAVDHNSTAELAALDRVAGQGHPVEQVVFSFTDEVALDGEPWAAYQFVARSDRWPHVLPHVRRVALAEHPDGVQDMEMDTVTVDGGVHRTRSVRLCLPPDRIVYKQLVPPALLLGHSGSWTFRDGPGGPTAVATHTVAVDVAAVPGVLGAGKTLSDARGYLRAALGANSRATLGYAARAAASTGSGS
ncbi:aromatase/cyclase [Saccharothrix syringae]|uniref:Cyclase n=1 Tax=Saccharothrix syringae TaxID=103733 RepID=A0A5Q0GY36_SACSY|nr:aromatase/cyclase [Saccharothrix syringae]QFZ18803.1 cyclase [Saccharothrix syringae]